MAEVRRRTSPLVVLGTPRLLAPGSLPGHRVLTATLVNRSGGPLEIDARDFALHDPSGERLRAAVQFDGPAHSKCAQVQPGVGVRITASWRGEAVAQLRFDGEPLWG